MMNKAPGPHPRDKYQIDRTHPRSRPGVNGTRERERGPSGFIMDYEVVGRNVPGKGRSRLTN